MKLKHIVAFALAILFCLSALATNKPAPTSSTTSSSQSSSLSEGGSSVGGSSDAWAVALPGHGSPSYAGQYSICVDGDGWFWNFRWTWRPNTECIKLIAEVTHLKAQPLPSSRFPAIDCSPPDPKQGKVTKAAKKKDRCTR